MGQFKHPKQPMDYCNVACELDKHTTCGGNNSYVDVFSIDTQSWAYEGCFESNDTHPDLLVESKLVGKTSIDNCGVSCRFMGYTYFGLTRGGYCRCGDSFGHYGEVHTCTMNCVKGTNHGKCGGKEATSVFRVLHSGSKVLEIVALMSSYPTYMPTNSPSTYPPTIYMPTNSPSTYPPTTYMPTNSPSTYPPTTYMPTNSPSTYPPTTYVPSSSPSTYPPTNSPTVESFSPTPSPIIATETFSCVNAGGIALIEVATSENWEFYEMGSMQGVEETDHCILFVAPTSSDKIKIRIDADFEGEGSTLIVYDVSGYHNKDGVTMEFYNPDPVLLLGFDGVSNVNSVGQYLLVHFQSTHQKEEFSVKYKLR